MSYQVNYSFTFRYNPERLHSVNVPLELLEDKPLEIDTVRSIVEEDHELLKVLLGDEYPSYCSMIMAPHMYDKHLQRFEEDIRLVKVEDES